MSQLMRSIVLAVVVEVFTACPAGGAPAGSCPATAPVATFIGSEPTCPDFGCGMNSPTIADGVVFDELNPNGEPDRHGIRIVSAMQAGKAVKLRVDRHWMSAVATDGSNIVFEHGALAGTVVELEKNGVHYSLKIDAVQEQSLRFWAGDTTEFVPFYRILTRLPGDQIFKAPVCRQDIATVEKVWAPVEHSAIAFTGDRYDPVQKTVSDAEQGTTWFNLACAGTATAKIHLMRHTNAGSWTPATWRIGDDVLSPASPFHTEPPQRQAMLKMFVADYCGDGAPFTIDGQPLLYDDAKHWYVPPLGGPAPSVAADGTLVPAGATVEALWTEHGALCLSHPRLVARGTIPCATGAAPLPMCTPEVLHNWDTAYHVISMNSCSTP